MKVMNRGVSRHERRFLEKILSRTPAVTEYSNRRRRDTKIGSRL
jgi:hypothetical protein